jgi:enoyl-CoA hydratase/long-chain 3-hydroxyacyl-CoA dehydrogenase
VAGRIITAQSTTRLVAPPLSTSRFLSSSAAVSTSSVTEKDSAPSPAASKAPFSPSPSRKYQFFQNVQITESGVAVIKFDNQDKPVNTISFALSKEAQQLWKNEIASNASVKAVVFASAKPGMFIAGADIFDIQSLENKQDVIPVIEEGLEFFQSMKKKGVPLVAAIDGPALGGGLEWALWCDYRICSDSSKTKLGLPEVKLGLLPGFGGTQNLPALVGLQNAMDMMLTGKEIRPDKAKKMGLVDLCVAPESLEKVAIESAEQLASGTLKAKRKPKSLQNKLLEDNKFGQSIIWNQIDKMIQKNTNGKYPAPFAIIDCVKYGLEHPKGNAKFKHEREQFAKLAATPESESLIGIFDGMTKMKKHSLGDVALPVKTVAVMGAGLMGAGIAQVSAEKGFNVLLKDRNDEAVGRGQSYMRDNWGKKLSRKRMTQYQYNINMSHVTPLADSNPVWKKHFGKCDVIVEAVFEDLNLKKKIVADMEAITPDHCIFATNVSQPVMKSFCSWCMVTISHVVFHYFVLDVCYSYP